MIFKPSGKNQTTSLTPADQLVVREIMDTLVPTLGEDIPIPVAIRSAFRAWKQLNSNNKTPLIPGSPAWQRWHDQNVDKIENGEM